MIAEFAQRVCDHMMNMRSYPVPKDAPAPAVVAHRGAWGGDIQENSMAAFERARSAGVWGIEFDVHFTADDVPVVHHDPELGRVVAAKGEIRELSWLELNRRAPIIPKRADVLALRDLHFMIEVKTALSDPQLQILAQHLAHLQPERDYHLLALSAQRVRCSASIPKAAWILVADLNTPQIVKACLDLDLGGVAGHYVLMSSRWQRILKARGKRVGVGFTPSANLFRREWGRGLDWVFTNQALALTADDRGG